MPKDYTISLKTLGGTWEFVGTDRARGVFAENLSPIVADRWGSLSCSFDLRRNPRNQWPDIGAFSDCDIEVGGIKTFAGRVKGTPSRDGADQAMNVQLEGMQAHLDDDVYVPAYVHTEMADWVDFRSWPTAPLASWRTSPVVVAGKGAITLSWPANTAVTTGEFVGVYLDFGAPGAKRIVLDWESSNNESAATFHAEGGDTPKPTNETAFTFTLGSGVSGSSSGNFTTARRYVLLSVQYNLTGTPGADVWVKLNNIRVYAETAYESGSGFTPGTTILKAPTVVRDALNRSTLLLSSDRSQIDPAGAAVFNVPSFHSRDNKTPREVWSGINAYHNFQASIDIDRRPIFKELPAAPEVEVGEWAAIEFEDASQGSGEDIYNHVIIEATFASTGQPLKVQQSSAQIPATTLTPITSPAVDNPSFTTNAANWAAVFGSIARTTTGGEFDSGAAGGKITPSTTIYNVIGTCTGTFRAGITYLLTFRAKAATASSAGFVALGSASVTSDVGVIGTVLTTSFSTVSVAWTPQADRTDAQITIGNAAASGNVFIDTFSLQASVLATALDRRGFIRTKLLQVSNALPDDGIAAAQIGDVYLRGHRTTPFKGRITITGPVREILTGKLIPPEQMLLRVNQLIRLSHLIDPDTGAVGRDGRIVQATYDYSKDQVTLDLDSTSSNFEALLSRLGAISSS